MPLPPPPAAAFNITGYPILAAISRAFDNDSKPREVPGTNGTPAFSICWRARVFDPMRSMEAGLGPINFMQASPQALAKAAFSERNPYPGWMASAPHQIG